MPLELDALETSFDLVAPRAETLVDIFYARLFAAAPAVKPLFAGTDLARQKSMLLATLVLLRKSLRNLDGSFRRFARWARGTSRTAPGPSTTRSSARC
jgi:hemoglobin-like flavoprotein